MELVIGIDAGGTHTRARIANARGETLGTGEAGREIEGPMAIVILGGLFTSTLLNLLCMPALYGKFAKGRSVSDKLTLRHVEGLAQLLDHDGL